MANKRKSKPFTDFLDNRITILEKLIVERKGTVPLDLDKLIRYLSVREHYEDLEGVK